MEPIGNLHEVTLGEKIERYPVLRTGERPPIPGWVRLAVWLRDGGKCELCGFLPIDGEHHLDHITPWSAGGADTSDNLRLLCAYHNQLRSNYRDPRERPRRPVTWWCVHCYGPSHTWFWTPEGFPVNCHIHGYRPCRVQNQSRRVLEAGQFTDWHRRTNPVGDDANILAYCAHCDVPALTTVAL